MGEINVQTLLLDAEESQGSEKALEREAVPWNVFLRLVLRECKRLWRLLWPSVIAELFTIGSPSVTQMFMGHMGSVSLAGSAIINLGVQGLAHSILLGMAIAVQTVGGQAYGAKKYSAMGVICQRSLVLQLLAAILLSVPYWYSGSFLEAIGEAKSIAKASQLYARGLIPQLVAFALFCPMRKFLQAQNIVNPMAYMSVATLQFHILISWLAVSVLKFGALGASLALSISWWVLLLMTWTYIIYSPSCRETWTGFSAKAFSGLWPYLKLIFLSAVMLVLELSFVPAMVIITGYLPNPEISVDTISVCISIYSWYFFIAQGFITSSSIRISNELGAAQPRVAKFSINVAVTASTIISLICSVLLLILRVYLINLYTDTPDVIKAAINLMPLLVVTILLVGPQPVLLGVAIGCGWQPIVVYINIGSYYLVGLPIGAVLKFKTSLAAAGMWVGLTSGIGVQTIALITVASMTNWNKEIEKAFERLKDTAAPEDTLAIADLE